jgi:hypothetical protein
MGKPYKFYPIVTSECREHTKIKPTSTLVCGFCPGSGSAAEKSFLLPSSFKRHLVSVHGVNSTASKCQSTGRALMHGEKPASDETRATGKCSSCSTTFTNVQSFYEHLDNCLLKVIRQGELSGEIDKRQLAGILPGVEMEPDTTTETSKRDRDELGDGCRASELYSDDSACASLLLAAPQELPQKSEAETLADTSHNSEYNVALFQVTGHDEGECETAVSLCDEGTIDDDSTETEGFSDSVSQASSWPGTPNTAERAEILSPIFEIYRRRIVDRLMSEFHSLLGHSSSFRNCVTSSESPSSQTPPSSSPAGSSSQKPPQGTKHQRDREGSEPPDDREGDGQRRQRPKLTSPGGTPTSRRFACPYYRRNASKHQNCRSCAGPGWDSVRRVK